MADAFAAGDSIEDFCRACKIDRMHTVVAADAGGKPLRVSCGYCGSEHNYRGGPRMGDEPRRAREVPAAPPSRSSAARAHETFPLVSERERTAPPVDPEHIGGVDFELLLRRIIREETGLTPAAPADKWRDGQLVLRPGIAGLQEKAWPIETFFHKIVMLRNRLRTLEQQVNALEVPEDVKVKLQGYITGCYGSLTSFNVLFAAEEDQFRGGGGD
ncbi:MAG TPA: hypothetical protein VL484_18640 [Vicinamibacterales bacterium]|jgi:hypothetical protein|nr:hypothetical protein [Vicinamibacterales bacterium]